MVSTLRKEELSQACISRVALKYTLSENASLLRFLGISTYTPACLPGVLLGCQAWGEHWSAHSHFSSCFQTVPWWNIVILGNNSVRKSFQAKIKSTALHTNNKQPVKPFSGTPRTAIWMGGPGNGA
jgi:hypothetical protein